MPRIDQALEAVVGAIDALTEPQDGGPGVVLTLGGLVVSGTIIPAWQWFHEVEHSARAAFVVHVGGFIDDEHGGWARLFKGAAESSAKDYAERRAAREATAGLPDRYQRRVARQDQTAYIHLTEARVLAPGVSPLPAAGMHWRGRLSEIPDGVGLENSMQRLDLRSSLADRSWMIVGCCCCRSRTGSCAGCSVWALC